MYSLSLLSFLLLFGASAGEGILNGLYFTMREQLHAFTGLTHAYWAKYIHTNFRDTKILELGPGTHPFPDASHDIDKVPYKVDESVLNGNKKEHVIMDFGTKKFPYPDNMFSFGYSANAFEELDNPVHAFEELTRVARTGFIMTTSPIIETTDIFGHATKFIGFPHHRYLFWTDVDTNILYALPKWSFLANVDTPGIFSEEEQGMWIQLLSRRPAYWNNYYHFNHDDPKKKPNLKVLSGTFIYDHNKPDFLDRDNVFMDAIRNGTNDAGGAAQLFEAHLRQFAHEVEEIKKKQAEQTKAQESQPVEIEIPTLIDTTETVDDKKE